MVENASFTPEEIITRLEELILRAELLTFLGNHIIRRVGMVFNRRGMRRRSAYQRRLLPRVKHANTARFVSEPRSISVTPVQTFILPARIYTFPLSEGLEAGTGNQSMWLKGISNHIVCDTVNNKSIWYKVWFVTSKNLHSFGSMAYGEAATAGGPVSTGEFFKYPISMLRPTFTEMNTSKYTHHDHVSGQLLSSNSNQTRTANPTKFYKKWLSLGYKYGGNSVVAPTHLYMIVIAFNEDNLNGLVLDQPVLRFVYYGNLSYRVNQVTVKGLIQDHVEQVLANREPMEVPNVETPNMGSISIE